MHYLNNPISDSLANLANQKQTQSEITLNQILINRLQYWTSPLKIVTLPVTLLAGFYESILEEGRNDIIKRKLTLEEREERDRVELERIAEFKRIRKIQLEQLYETAKAPELTPRQVINRRNASAPRKSKNQG